MWLLFSFIIVVFLLGCGALWFRLIRPSLGYRMEGPP